MFPLPVEGFETRVIADDEQVINYMIELSEALDESRTERLMGWYHSHPFDVDEARNHCFLSNTDMNTQLAWQRAEDPNGNPWLAVVIDPLRSFAKNKPEFGAFRVYPPEYNAPLNETPDGTIVTDDATRIEHWGSCWNRYYQLQVEYFMSTQAKTVIDTLSKTFLWMRTLGSTPALERRTASASPSASARRSPRSSRASTCSSRTARARAWAATCPRPARRRRRRRREREGE